MSKCDLCDDKKVVFTDPYWVACPQCVGYLSRTNPKDGIIEVVVNSGVYDIPFEPEGGWTEYIDEEEEEEEEEVQS
jgi:hypothetical protein